MAIELERCRALAEQAVEIARAAGDPAALAHTLANATAATWGTDTLQQRKRVSDELTELVQHMDDPRLSFWAALRRMVVGLQAGERSQVESGIASMRTLAASVPQPLIAWTRLKLESVWALVQGDLQAAEQWATQAHEVGTASGEPDAAIRWRPGVPGSLLPGAVWGAARPDARRRQRTEQPRVMARGRGVGPGRKRPGGRGSRAAACR